MLSMIMCKQNLVEFCPSILKILSKNQFLTSIKGCNSVANLRKMTPYCSNIDLVNDNVVYKIWLKSVHPFSRYLAKTNFRHLSRALTLHLLVRSGQNSNSVYTCWLSSLPEKKEEDPIKNVGSTVVTTIFQTRKGR